jgi:DtxR family Mn-dependent transcriptional regulator
MEKKKLSKSLEDYLEAIYVVAKEKRIVRVKDLIKMLNVKTASVIGALKKLEQKGYVEHEHYGYIELTPEGEKKALRIYEKHTMLMKFLTQFLKVNEEVAEGDACLMEHCVSEETFDKIMQLMRLFEISPDKVPTWFSETSTNMDSDEKMNPPVTLCDKCA